MARETYTIAEVLEYGPLMLVDDEYGVAITMNGAYVNVWPYDGTHFYAAAECYAMPSDLYTMTGAQMLDYAKECLERFTQPDDDETDDDQESE